MDYKQHELFKMLDSMGNSLEAMQTMKGHDRRFTFTVHNGELHTEVHAFIGKMEVPVKITEDYGKKAFIFLCKQLDEHEGE